MKLLNRLSAAPVLRWAPASGALAIVAFFGLGCSVSSDTGDSAEGSSNSCVVDSDCESGMCRTGICQGRNISLERVLLQITPPADADRIAGLNFTQVVDVNGERLDLQLEHVSDLAGQVTAASVSPESCVTAATSALAPAADGSFPIRMTFVPRERLLGVPNPSYTREVLPSDAQSYAFAVSLPPGNYDIYAEPLASDGDCVRPPHLFLDQEVEPGDVELDLVLPAPEKLDLIVSWPEETDRLSGWTLDILERDSGRRLSSRVVLSEPKAGKEEGFEYRAQVAFSSVVAADSVPTTELVRLSPPEGEAAPTLFFERSVVQLFQEDQALINQLDGLPTSVVFSGRVTREGTTQAAPSTVTLNAVELDGLSAGTIASFSRTVQTDEEGFFEVELLPGRYRVEARPDMAGLSTQRIDIVVSGALSVQAGKVVELGPQVSLEGAVLFDGEGVEGVPVHAVAPPSPVGVFERLTGLTPLLPRSSPGLSSKTGGFQILAEPGTFHLVARPEASSGLPWAAVLGVKADGEVEPVGEIRVAAPRVLRGELRSQELGRVVPSSLIRVYGYLEGDRWTNDPAAADSVLAIAEARVNERGEFRLLLPSEL